MYNNNNNNNDDLFASSDEECYDACNDENILKDEENRLLSQQKTNNLLNNIENNLNKFSNTLFSNNENLGGKLFLKSLSNNNNYSSSEDDVEDYHLFQSANSYRSMDPSLLSFSTSSTNNRKGYSSRFDKNNNSDSSSDDENDNIIVKNKYNNNNNNNNYSSSDDEDSENKNQNWDYALECWKSCNSRHANLSDIMGFIAQAKIDKICKFIASADVKEQKSALEKFAHYADDQTIINMVKLARGDKTFVNPNDIFTMRGEETDATALPKETVDGIEHSDKNKKNATNALSKIGVYFQANKSTDSERAITIAMYNQSENKQVPYTSGSILRRKFIKTEADYRIKQEEKTYEENVLKMKTSTRSVRWAKSIFSVVINTDNLTQSSDDLKNTQKIFDELIDYVKKDCNKDDDTLKALLEDKTFTFLHASTGRYTKTGKPFDTITAWQKSGNGSFCGYNYSMSSKENND